MINLHFDETLGERYKSKSQKIRVMSENWVGKNMFCPCCGDSHIFALKNNEPVADMKCNNCGEIFELKSKKGNIGKKINDGAYTTMLRRITSITNPELLVMQYSSDYIVTDLIFIPKFFFVPQIIEKRKPLASTARRAGWIGCNYIKKLETSDINTRSWLLDVLECIDKIKSKEFCLQEIYAYSTFLQEKHVNNHNVEAKIRQQLQFLRDKGYIEFLGRGHYKKRI